MSDWPAPRPSAALIGRRIGLAKNARPGTDAEMWMGWAEAAYRHGGDNERLFVELRYRGAQRKAGLPALSAEADDFTRWPVSWAKLKRISGKSRF